MKDEEKKETRKNFVVAPPADVYDERDGVEISFEVPGVRSGDLKIEARTGMLSIEAQSSLKHRGQPVEFRRTFYLSDAVDIGGIRAKASDGVLTLFLPKQESAKPHKIKVD